MARRLIILTANLVAGFLDQAALSQVIPLSGWFRDSSRQLLDNICFDLAMETHPLCQGDPPASAGLGDSRSMPF